MVTPASADPSQSYYNGEITEVPEQTAGESYNFVIQLVDEFGNKLSESGGTVNVQATYNNHNDWLSPIGVPDDEYLL